MNIVKLKDLLMPENSAIAEFFNKNLKGKYAYWIQMRYIFPLESLDYKTYIQYEQLDDVYFLGPDMLPHIDLYSEECCMMDFARVYIDINVTEEINSVYEYSAANNYVADSDIDIAKLRTFRTWLATELLKFNTSADEEYMNKYTNEETHVLEYYKNGMYNDVVKHLSTFGSSTGISTASMTSACGCANSTNILYTTNVNVCDAQKIYIDNIHKYMVKMFEEVTFWKQFNKDFLKTFKKYIDNIIKTGLTISSTTYGLIECVCSSSSDISSSSMMLTRLSEALQYIINDDINGHNNFIHDALYNWAEYLYDYMNWEI